MSEVLLYAEIYARPPVRQRFVKVKVEVGGGIGGREGRGWCCRDRALARALRRARSLFAFTRSCKYGGWWVVGRRGSTQHCTAYGASTPTTQHGSTAQQHSMLHLGLEGLGDADAVGLGLGPGRPLATPRLPAAAPGGPAPAPAGPGPRR